LTLFADRACKCTSTSSHTAATLHSGNCEQGPQPVTDFTNVLPVLASVTQYSLGVALRSGPGRNSQYPGKRQCGTVTWPRKGRSVGVRMCAPGPKTSATCAPYGKNGKSGVQRIKYQMTHIFTHTHTLTLTHTHTHTGTHVQIYGKRDMKAWTSKNTYSSWPTSIVPLLRCSKASFS
jgi:hypothetical protein